MQHRFQRTGLTPPGFVADALFDQKRPDLVDGGRPPRTSRARTRCKA